MAAIWAGKGPTDVRLLDERHLREGVEAVRDRPDGEDDGAGIRATAGMVRSVGCGETEVAL